jgi:uncharacterized protein (TIGR03435 family)
MKALILGICLLSSLLAQAPKAPAFEVATIKPFPEGAPIAPVAGRRPIEVVGDRFSTYGMSVRFIIGQAYGVAAIYVFGEDWLDAKFDIDAKIPAGASEKQIPEMLRTLLAERFGLRIHRETRQMPIYALTVAKGGLKVKELPPNTPDSRKTVDGRTVNTATLEYIGAAGSFAGLAHPLRNMTGLSGKYEISLDPALIFAGIPTGNAGRDIDDSDAVSRMRQAVAPLGLEINSAKQPIDAVVVDHIEHTPKEN